MGHLHWASESGSQQEGGNRTVGTGREVPSEGDPVQTVATQDCEGPALQSTPMFHEKLDI